MNERMDVILFILFVGGSAIVISSIFGVGYWEKRKNETEAKHWKELLHFSLLVTIIVLLAGIFIRMS